MSTQTFDTLDSLPAADARHSGVIGTFKAIIAAIGEGARAADRYNHLTRNGVPHDVAARKVLVGTYKA